MSKLSRVLAKPEILKTKANDGTDIDFTLYPLTNKELMEMTDISRKKGIREGLNYLLYTSLMKTEKDITMKEVEEMPANLALEMANIISSLSGLGNMFDQKKMTPEEAVKNMEMGSNMQTGSGAKRSIIESLDAKLAAGEI